ncbi:MAG: FAD-binding oxidoreductase [Proteobacteria bacterium]|nr:FAD-binding oxidoreductase [Pseudomonadota bacterium]
MGNLGVTTREGGKRVLTQAEVDGFRSDLRGALLLPGDDGYDEARRIYNAMIDKRPALIARCAGAEDVVRAVTFARDHDLLVSVRGGGHNIAGNAVSDGGLMIDLSGMKSIQVDPAEQTARAEPGVTWAELDKETQAHGLATPGGTIPSTGIAGLTLGGGIGWLKGKYGLACDNLLSVEIVTADGRQLTASAEDNADLFWGVRGGGGNFGIVTSFEYRLHPVGKVLGGMAIHPLEKAKDVLAHFRTFMEGTPDELVCTAVFLTSPDGDPVLAIAVCYHGALDEGEAVLKPLREFGPPAADNIAPMDYTALQSMIEAAFPSGWQNYWKSDALNDLSDEAIEVMAERFATVPAPTIAVIVEYTAGAAGRVPVDATAFPHRETRYNILILGTWPDAADNERNIGWVRGLWQALQPFSSGGVYVNYLAEAADEGAERIQAAYGPRTYGRLVALKNKYDPTNLFRLNQNIKPTP